MFISHCNYRRNRLRLYLLLFALLASYTAKAHYPVSSPDVPVSAVLGGPGFTLNPNPVNGTVFYVNLEFTEAEYPDTKIIITNVLGQVVYTAPIRKTEFAVGKVRIDLGEARLDKGVYFVQVSSGEFTKTQKLAVR